MAEGETYDALGAADLAIVSSGTATVEAALMDAPMIVIYRVAPITAAIVGRLVRTPMFAMVNLIAGKRVVPELVQKRLPHGKSASHTRLRGCSIPRRLSRKSAEDLPMSGKSSVLPAQSTAPRTSLPECWLVRNSDLRHLPQCHWQRKGLRWVILVTQEH